jgi:hypothetical protein
MIKQTLFTGWHLMRWVRLALGLFLTVTALQSHDALSGILGGFLLLQAFTNVGCFGPAGCSVPNTKVNLDEVKEVEFEEIKSK